MKVAVEHIFTGLTAGFTGGVPAVGVTAGYDPDKTLLASFMKQYTGSNPEDKYVSIKPSAIVNNPETANTSYFCPHVYKWSDNIYWVFVAQNATAAATRTIGLYEFDSNATTLTWKGYITMSGTTISGNKTVRGLRAFVYKHTTGTVSTSGSSTTITGSGTGFQSERIAVGARIGFGSTDPTQITSWYEISTISSDTSMTISAAVDLSAGTAYVIEEIRILLACTNVTATNGGPHLIKGLNYGTFQSGGTTISEASSTDNVRASYLLKDAATTTMTVAMGVASDEQASNTDHTIYFLNLDSATTVRIHKLNIRAALTVSSGSSTSAWVFKTGTQSITGTASQVNNGRIFTVNHLSAAGDKSVWFVTTTRVYRCNVDDIIDAGTSWLSDSMNEIPPGTSTTYVATASMNQVDYSDTLDRLLIPTGNGRFATYIGEYDTSNTVPFEKIFGNLTNRLKLSTTGAGTVDGFFPAAVPTIWTEGGYIFATPSIVTTGLNWLLVFPLSPDGYYASTTGQRVVTPRLATTNATKLYRSYVEHAEYIGTYNLGFPPESFRIYYRTTGIDDNSGSWTEVPAGGDLTSVTPSSYIQFMFEFDILGEICVPARIYGVSCVFEDGSQDSHYQPSLTKSSATNRQFAWKQVSAWGSNIPNMQIRLYNTATNFLVLDDTVTGSNYGTWEYSPGGTAWSGWSAGADTVGNYIRYTADELPNNITVRALLTQA
jgi:hypothetical protein